MKLTTNLLVASSDLISATNCSQSDFNQFFRKRTCRGMIENILWFYTNLLVNDDGQSEAYKDILTKTCFFDTLQKMVFSPPKFLQTLEHEQKLDRMYMLRTISWSLKNMCLEPDELRQINDSYFQNIIQLINQILT